MKKANYINKALLLFTLLFMLIAAFSFAAFKEGKEVCAEATKCTQTAPGKKGSEMLWDGFSRHFIMLISIN